ncbi:winged helix-turn-helix domain-containing protein [Falsihalocynthiibacter arcticus]|uniref:Cytoplasmic protein n=1 Tax=Falsihalocynthiibacter arcticus TaxID=1579316 RepID=A0A126UY68_9RHOB|nr:crosslink repair DNA glycosylase YcaQ family protein [Falsihalocynthiibacter arcticus]AML51011.1 hypothetical protein RC74_06745 [Falsihalocynthiibacter arcticus]
MVRTTKETPLRIDNRTARRLWLHSQGLGKAPTGPLDALGIIRKMGFVQLDSIQIVSRAHHHILWSRNQKYREHLLDEMLAKHRSVFEHFTHDASIIPMEFLPMWRRQFRRKREYLDKSSWFNGLPNTIARKAIKSRIAAEGPLSTHAFDTKITGPKKMWSRPPHKLALDYMWYTGELATSHRVNFTKYYDLAERIYPEPTTAPHLSDQQQIDWLCHAALDRMGFGTIAEVQKFWEAVDRTEVRNWVEAKSDVRRVDIVTAQGTLLEALAPADIEERIANLKPPTSRLRILNPFDPVIRDRNRLSRLFGFEYRVEMFVPAAKRIWGYYVFPVLEGDRFVGRIELKADRKNLVLHVLNFWPESGTNWPSSRREKLEAELDRLARFVGTHSVSWS